MKLITALALISALTLAGAFPITLTESTSSNDIGEECTGLSCAGGVCLAGICQATGTGLAVKSVKAISNSTTVLAEASNDPAGLGEPCSSRPCGGGLACLASICQATGSDFAVDSVKAASKPTSTIIPEASEALGRGGLSAGFLKKVFEEELEKYEQKHLSALESFKKHPIEMDDSWLQYLDRFPPKEELLEIIMNVLGKSNIYPTNAITQTFPTPKNFARSDRLACDEASSSYLPSSRCNPVGATFKPTTRAVGNKHCDKHADFHLPGSFCALCIARGEC